MKVAIDISDLSKLRKHMTSPEIIIEVGGVPAKVPFRVVPSGPVLGCAPSEVQ